jgi:flagellar basal-body rod protein FlgF
MDTGLYQGVAATRVHEKRLEAIAANLANVGTNGFKRQATASRAFEVGTGERKHVEVMEQSSTDHSQGMIERTGNTLDLALDGEGFFAVDGPTGIGYTRDGALHTDEKGVLQNAQGFPVVWEGSRGQIKPVGEPVTVDGSGEVRQGTATIGRIRVVDFENRGSLEQDRDGLWRAPAGARERSATAIVHQGALERSNVNAMDELVALIVTQRGMETATGVIKTIDQSYKRLNQPH